MTPELPRAVLVGVQLTVVTDDLFASSLLELRRLAETLGLKVVAQVAQKRGALDKGTVVGEGKLLELARFTGGSGRVPSGAKIKKQKRVYVSGAGHVEAVGDEEDDEAPVADALPVEERAAVVLVDHDLSPSQARNLERATGVEVMDRTSLILEIFRRHARSREAKLEVEIARLEYEAPRIREMGGGGDRQRGGVGGRGAGESSSELDRRKVRDRISELRRELASIDKTSRTRRQQRSGQRTAVLVGYTNAGKSSLMRALTGSDVYVADKLFATLGTTVRALSGAHPRVLVSDTVGFIKKLPHSLVASFRATLEEAAEAELVLHVVDGADAAFREQMEVTTTLLGEIGASAPRLLVMNKRDKLTDEEQAALQAELPDAIFVSSRDAADVARLSERIVAFFERDAVEADLLVPYSRQSLLPDIFESCRVLSETYEEAGAVLRVRAEARTLERLGRALA